MMHAVLITFASSLPADDLDEPFRRYAEALASDRRLVMKTWLTTGARFGGFHLFDDRSAAEAYLDGELFATVVGNAAFSNFSVEHFDVIDGLSAITGSPVSTAEADA